MECSAFVYIVISTISDRRDGKELPQIPEGH